MRKGKKGILTIFISLLLTGILTFCCVISEGVRIAGAQIQIQAATDAGVDSLFSEYHRLLMESYGLFFISGDYETDRFAPENLEERLNAYIEANLNPESAGVLLQNTDFWRLSVSECRVTGYLLATDDDCSAYRKQAADCMKGEISRQMLAKLFSWEDEPVNLDDLEETFTKLETDNQEEIEQLEQEEENQEETEQSEQEEDNQQEMEQPEQEEGEADDVDENNPITIIQQLKKTGILQFVVQSPETLSTSSISTENAASKRTLGTGNLETEETGTMEELTEKVLFYEYLLEYFSDYRENRELTGIDEKALTYEMEYIIAGKGSDLENLKEVVNKLLLMREAVNFAYLMTDEVKQIQAETLAVTITGLVGVAPLAAAVKYGILLAWAYGESIMDVRNLLAGGTVALVKSADNWQLSLSNFSELLSGADGTCRQEENGLSYMDYLRLLLYSTKEETLTLRSLDLIETNIRQQTGNASFMADGLIEKLSVEVDCQMEPLFLSGSLIQGFTGYETFCMTAIQGY